MKVYKIILKIAKWIWQPKKLPYLCSMKIMLNDSGQILEGSNEKQIVAAIMNTSKIPYNSTIEYMRDYSRRALIMNDEDISFVNENAFINDLVKYEHVKIL